MANKKVIAIQHAPYEDLGNLAPVLQQNGFTIKYLHATKDDLDINPTAADLLVVLGGPMGVYEQTKYPFLSQEIKILQQRLGADLPTLGICLGAQLMAAALGAKVTPGPIKEIGWAEITLSTAGQDSCLKVIPTDVPVFHWHGDTFELPQDTVRLASSAVYENQAFVSGQRCLGMQFHPEVTHDEIKAWLKSTIPSELEDAPYINLEHIAEDTKRFIDPLQTHASALWNCWLKKVKLIS